jgi:hypothetical protein
VGRTGAQRVASVELSGQTGVKAMGKVIVATITSRQLLMFRCCSLNLTLFDDDLSTAYTHIYIHTYIDICICIYIYIYIYSRRTREDNNGQVRM